MPITVTVWGENIHERRDPRVTRLYPDGMHETIAAGLRARLGDGAVVRTATLQQEEHGLTDDVLATTDVLTWWGHAAHEQVDDAVVARVQQAVLNGMGLVVLHSGHHSKIFTRLMGTTCSLRWREADDRVIVWTVDPTHPIAAGLPASLIVPADEMYGEFFDIPRPDDLVFLSTYSGGEVFRSGCCWRRGWGRVFYFAHGHETYPVYHQAEVQQVLANGVRWAAGDRERQSGRYLTVKSPTRLVRAAGRRASVTREDGTARRALLVGAGNMGRAWARNLRATPGVHLAGWVNVSAEALAGAVAEAGLDGLPTDTDLDRALVTIEPEVVVDVSPPAAHHDVTLAALAAGAAVLGEKPMADSMERARAMVAAAERAGRLYMVSQSRRYNPSLAAFRRLLAETGPPAIVTADFFVGARERGHRLTIGQPLLLDMAIHAFDMARFLTGADPVSVLCDTFNPPWSWFRGDAAATAIFEMTGGLRFVYRGSWCSEGRHTAWDGEWRASGPNGSATWRGGDDAPVAEIVTARGGFLPETEERRGIVEESPKGDRRVAARLPARPRHRRGPAGRVPRQHPDPGDGLRRDRGGGDRPARLLPDVGCAAGELMGGSRMDEQTTRLTMAQAVIAFLKAQRVERDGVERPFFAGCFGIFGHGNIAGVGQALQQQPDFRYYQCRNEQAMVHTAAAFAKTRTGSRPSPAPPRSAPARPTWSPARRWRPSTACRCCCCRATSSPAATSRRCLQQLESEQSQDISVNDCFKPVSRYWDRINRPDQLLTALPEAMRVLTSPAETGAVTLALPQDVQTEAFEYPAALFRPRVWYIPRNRPDRAALERAAAWIRASRRPLIVAGGGVRYSEATEALRRFVDRTGIPVGETMAGKGSLPL